MDVDRFCTAMAYQVLHGIPGIPFPTFGFGYKDTIHLHAIRMLHVPGRCSKFPVKKYPEYAFMHRICLLAMVLFPQVLCQVKLIPSQFTGLGRHDLISSRVHTGERISYGDFHREHFFAVLYRNNPCRGIVKVVLALLKKQKIFQHLFTPLTY
jgi:hypothetical protein